MDSLSRLHWLPQTFISTVVSGLFLVWLGPGTWASLLLLLALGFLFLGEHEQLLHDWRARRRKLIEENRTTAYGLVRGFRPFREQDFDLYAQVQVSQAEDLYAALDGAMLPLFLVPGEPGTGKSSVLGAFLQGAFRREVQPYYYFECPFNSSEFTRSLVEELSRWLECWPMSLEGCLDRMIQNGGRHVIVLDQFERLVESKDSETLKSLSTIMSRAHEWPKRFLIVIAFRSEFESQVRDHKVLREYDKARESIRRFPVREARRVLGCLLAEIKERNFSRDPSGFPNEARVPALILLNLAKAQTDVRRRQEDKDKMNELARGEPDVILRGLEAMDCTYRPAELQVFCWRLLAKWKAGSSQEITTLLRVESVFEDYLDDFLRFGERRRLVGLLFALTAPGGGRRQVVWEKLGEALGPDRKQLEAGIDVLQREGLVLRKEGNKWELAHDLVAGPVEVAAKRYLTEVKREAIQNVVEEGVPLSPRRRRPLDVLANGGTFVAMLWVLQVTAWSILPSEGRRELPALLQPLGIPLVPMYDGVAAVGAGESATGVLGAFGMASFWVCGYLFYRKWLRDGYVLAAIEVAEPRVVARVYDWYSAAVTMASVALVPMLLSRPGWWLLFGSVGMTCVLVAQLLLLAVLARRPALKSILLRSIRGDITYIVGFGATFYAGVLIMSCGDVSGGQKLWFSVVASLGSIAAMTGAYLVEGAEAMFVFRSHLQAFCRDVERRRVQRT